MKGKWGDNGEYRRVPLELIQVEQDAADALYDDHDVCVGSEGLSGFAAGQAEDTIAVLRRSGFAVVREADSVDAAWAEAEAALPEGWHVSIYPIRGGGRDEPPWEAYRAAASLRTLELQPEGIVQSDLEPTLERALRALAARLRERAG